MPTYSLHVNGQKLRLEAAPDEPLLWALRDALGLKGTKFGCGLALCGACTVHLDGQPIRSCQMPVSMVKKKQKITTIEAMEADPVGRAVQAAWVEVQAPQCGYCQSGQIMSAVAFLRENPRPDDAAIERAMSGNLCRCGTYPRIRKAVRMAADALNQSKPADSHGK